jgi:hypothetical protein
MRRGKTMLNYVLSAGMAYPLYSVFLTFPIFFSVSAPNNIKMPKRSSDVCACLRSCSRACVRMSISSAEPVHRYSRNLVQRYALRGHLKAVLLVLPVSNNNMADARKCGSIANIVLLNLEPEVIWDTLTELFLTWLRFFLPWLRFFRSFSSVVREMPG